MDNLVTCDNCKHQYDKTLLTKHCCNCFCCTGCEIYICPNCDSLIEVIPVQDFSTKEKSGRDSKN